jgi:hypothetical protein
MGLAEISIIDQTSIKVIQLLKLASDGENWLTYQEQVFNAATACGLHCHLVGTVIKPSPLIEKDRKFYLSSDSDVPPLDKEAIEKHEKLLGTEGGSGLRVGLQYCG